MRAKRNTDGQDRHMVPLFSLRSSSSDLQAENVITSRIPKWVFHMHQRYGCWCRRQACSWDPSGMAGSGWCKVTSPHTKGQVSPHWRKTGLGSSGDFLICVTYRICAHCSIKTAQHTRSRTSQLKNMRKTDNRKRTTKYPYFKITGH